MAEHSFDLYGDGKDVTLRMSVLTAVIYERQFGSDLVADFVGSQHVKESETGDYVLDFTQTNWTAVVQLLWASLKSASSRTPGYEKWAAKAESINLLDVKQVLEMLISDTFFRSGAAGSE